MSDAINCRCFSTILRRTSALRSRSCPNRHIGALATDLAPAPLQPLRSIVHVQLLLVPLVVASVEPSTLDQCQRLERGGARTPFLGCCNFTEASAQHNATPLPKSEKNGGPSGVLFVSCTHVWWSQRDAPPPNPVDEWNFQSEDQWVTEEMNALRKEFTEERVVRCACHRLFMWGIWTLGRLFFGSWNVNGKRPQEDAVSASKMPLA